MQRRSLLIAIAAALAGARAVAQSYREIPWDDLIPKDWDPVKLLRGQGNTDAVRDGTPQAADFMRKLRELWDNAPTVGALDNASIRLPGYVVPLEATRDELKEFLLVPYFGACIHTPPPPANQIVHVVAATPAKGFRTMDTVWVSGRLKTVRGDSSMGASGYRLDAALVERYTATR